eukprot:gnl/TRDRNA2_/TRDRNA2_172223_c2_seq6.p1 gnl/TRDRNA2_/TRDRNA2_172223_c2~~gnl/TRDRNA2_/TRDRNA2_172223_c2_seq6.p1  ORF type:complete len:164 (-),score=11.03 gnl/TRDRNA2_/TRDRNA2_172223_c2_seq6:45-536(-)
MGVNTGGALRILGGSIHMWRHYFGRHIEYHGVDLNPDCKRFEDPAAGIFIHVGTLDNRQFLTKIVRAVGGDGSVDLVNDDASHDDAITLASLFRLLPTLNPDGGIYMVEDITVQPYVVNVVSAWNNVWSPSNAHGNHDVVQHYYNVLFLTRWTAHPAHSAFEI